MIREYASLKKLRRGEILDLGGILVRMAEGEIQKGDLYVAERNTGPKLLIAMRIEKDAGFIVPSEGYPYDIGECVKVCEA